jgi:HlyD family secretion protein
VLFGIGVFYSVRMVTRARLPIRVGQVQMGDIVSNNSTNGIVEPQVDFEAHAPYAGLIKAVYVHEGDLVSKGKLLVVMDDTQAKTHLATALTGLRAAQASYDAVAKGGSQQERLTLSGDVARTQADRDNAQQQLVTLQKLASEGSASPSEVAAAQQRLDQANLSLKLFDRRKQSPYAPVDLEHAQAALADAQAGYSAAEETLRQTEVRAPFDGTVYFLPVSATEYVQQGDHLLQMADLTKMQVRAYFDEPEIGKLAIGVPIKIVWDAKPGRSWQGKITRLPSIIIEYTTRHIGVAIVTIDNADGTLLPNTNVTVTATTSITRNTLTMPREGLHSSGGRDFVYLLDGETLRRTPVQVGVNDLTAIQILSGLTAGQTVALGTTNGEPLLDGVPVKVVR